MEVCVQTGGLFGPWGAPKGCELIRQAGFAGIDWNLNTAWDRSKVEAGILEHCIFEDSREEIRAYYQPEMDAIAASGLYISQAHAPFPAYVPGYPEFNEYAVKVTKNCVRLCADAGIKHVVVHGISLGLTDYTQTRESIRQMNYHLYESLIPVLQDSDVILCLENLFSRHNGRVIEGTCSVPEEAIEYIDTLNETAGKECFGFCLDTGHLSVLGKNIPVFIRAMGKRIKALHLHDTVGTDTDHLAPYTGDIIWKDVIQALKDVGYEGDISFETYKQVAADRVDPEAIPIWLNTIYRLGALFKDNILG